LFSSGATAPAEPDLPLSESDANVPSTLFSRETSSTKQNNNEKTKSKNTKKQIINNLCLICHQSNKQNGNNSPNDALPSF
jgi:hypothetical protein